MPKFYLSFFFGWILIFQFLFLRTNRLNIGNWMETIKLLRYTIHSTMKYLTSLGYLFWFVLLFNLKKSQIQKKMKWINNNKTIMCNCEGSKYKCKYFRHDSPVFVDKIHKNKGIHKKKENHFHSKILFLCELKRIMETWNVLYFLLLSYYIIILLS